MQAKETKTEGQSHTRFSCTGAGLNNAHCRFSQPLVEDDEKEFTPEDDRGNLQKVLIETSEKIIPGKQTVQEQQWMADEIIKFIYVETI